MRALVLLAALAWQDSPGGSQPDRPEVEAQVVGCFGINEVTGVGTNTYILDARNNSRADLTLHLEIEGATVVTRKVSLPRLTRQRYFIYMPVPPGSASGYAVWRLSDDRGRSIGARENTVEASTIGDPTRGVKVLVLAEAAMSAAPFDFPHRFRGERVDTAECGTRNLPDSWIGLKGFQFVVLYNYPMTELSPRQLQALQDWVIAGGRLVTIAPVDPVNLQIEWMERMYPLDIPAPSFVRSFPYPEPLLDAVLPSREPFAFYEFRAGSRLEKEGRPLFVEHGRGRAYLVPFDAMREPFAGRREFKHALWTGIFEHAVEPAAAEKGMRLHPREIPGVAQLVFPPPPLWTVLLILASFVVLVGPANYVFLFSRGRPLLSVVTIPAISIVCAAVILAIGLLFRSGRQATNNVVLLQAQAGSPHASESRIVTHVSTRHASYDFEFRRGTYVFPHEIVDPDSEFAWRGHQNPDHRIRLEQLDDGFAVRRLRLARFAGTVFQGESVRNLGGGGVNLVVESGEVRVSNASSHRIVRAAYLERNGSACLLDAIGEGREVRAPIRPDAGAQRATEHLCGGDPVLREIVSAAMRERADALYVLLENDPGHVSIDGRADNGIRTIVLLRVPR